jgi:hypothetical protein
MLASFLHSCKASAKPFSPVEIQWDIKSRSQRAASRSKKRNGAMACPLIDFFVMTCTTAVLSMAKCRLRPESWGPQSSMAFKTASISLKLMCSLRWCRGRFSICLRQIHCCFAELSLSASASTDRRFPDSEHLPTLYGPSSGAVTCSVISLPNTLNTPHRHHVGRFQQEQQTVIGRRRKGCMLGGLLAFAELFKELETWS